MSLFDWFLVVVYFALLALIGYQTTRRIESVEDYNIAGERLIWPVLFASLSAAVLGGGASTGNAGKVYQDGYVFMFAFCAYAVAQILVGYFVAPRLKDYRGAQTVGDIMEKHYGRKSKLLTGILSIGLCTGILGAQALALGTLFSVILDMPSTVGIIVGMGVVILYTTFGGAWAVIQTDVMQFIFLGTILPAALLIGLFKVGGPHGLIENVPATHFTFLGKWDILTFVSLFVTFLLGEALIPPYTQRVFSTKDSSHSQKGYLITGLFSFGFYFVTGSLGLIAYVLFPNIQPDQALPIIIRNLLPIGIKGLAVAALLAVIMSTASSFLNSTTVSFMQDIYKYFIKNKEISERRLLFIERILTFVIGVISIVLALNAPSIIDALTYSYYLWAPTIVFPLILATVWKIHHTTAGLSAILSGAIVTAIWTWGFQDPFGLPGVIPGLIANILAFFVAYGLTKAAQVNKGEVFRR